MKWDDEIRVKRPTWRGVEYDSQLEADWASTFTAWGMEFVYHPGRLFLSGGVVWEPDFQLDNDIVFEVKGAGNERIEKVRQAAHETQLNVIIGRTGWMPAGSDTESAGAVWESEEWAIDVTGKHPVFVRHADELALHYTAHYAYARGLYGSRMFKAVEDSFV